MAKSRSRVLHKRSFTARRVVTSNATPRVPRRIMIPMAIASSGEDFRRYHPLAEFRPLKTLQGRYVAPRAIVKSSYKPRRSVAFKVPAALRRFSSLSVAQPLRVEHWLPRNAVICARRKVRRSVMFAMNKAGRGGQRTPRRNYNSNVHCER